MQRPRDQRKVTEFSPRCRRLISGPCLSSSSIHWENYRPIWFYSKMCKSMRIPFDLRIQKQRLGSGFSYRASHGSVSEAADSGHTLASSCSQKYHIWSCSVWIRIAILLWYTQHTIDKCVRRSDRCVAREVHQSWFGFGAYVQIPWSSLRSSRGIRDSHMLLLIDATLFGESSGPCRNRVLKPTVGFLKLDHDSRCTKREPMTAHDLHLDLTTWWFPLPREVTPVLLGSWPNLIPKLRPQPPLLSHEMHLKQPAALPILPQFNGQVFFGLPIRSATRNSAPLDPHGANIPRPQNPTTCFVAFQHGISESSRRGRRCLVHSLSFEEPIEVLCHQLLDQSGRLWHGWFDASVQEMLCRWWGPPLNDRRTSHFQRDCDQQHIHTLRHRSVGSGCPSEGSFFQQEPRSRPDRGPRAFSGSRRFGVLGTRTFFHSARVPRWSPENSSGLGCRSPTGLHADLQSRRFVHCSNWDVRRWISEQTIPGVREGWHWWNVTRSKGLNNRSERISCPATQTWRNQDEERTLLLCRLEERWSACMDHELSTLRLQLLLLDPWTPTSSCTVNDSTCMHESQASIRFLPLPQLRSSEEERDAAS